MTADYSVPQPNDGNWLSSPGSYRNLVQSLISCDPQLKHRDPKAVVQHDPWPSEDSRIVCLEPGADSKFRQAGYWTEPKDFRTHLAHQGAMNGVILVEGLSPELVDILGSNFNIHPSFFVDHERVIVFNLDPNRYSDIPALPSCRRRGSRQTRAAFRYFEVLNLPTAPSTFNLTCADSGRHVGVTRIRGNISSSVVARRKCSVWPVSGAGIGSLCIIICDPPLRRVRTKTAPGALHRPVFPVHTTPYNGGYRDFMDLETQIATMKGPPRSSMLDDLQHYLITHGSSLPNQSVSETATAFIELIVASHYLSLTSFMKATLSGQQWDLSRQQDMSRFSISTAEQQWSDLQSWERRLNEYCTAIEDIMLTLGIEFREPDALRTDTQSPSSAAGVAAAAAATATNFQYLRTTLQNLRHRAEQINAATSGLASIAGNRQAYHEAQLALREARRTKSLTLVGLIFIPLAYTATLFSMNERYMPGGTHFWVYFSVSGPLIGAVILGYLVLNRVFAVGGGRAGGFKESVVHGWTWSGFRKDGRNRLGKV